MHRLLLAFLTFALLLPAGVLAQEDEGLPACTSLEVLAIWTALADLDMSSVEDVAADLGSEDRAARVQVIAAISDVQRRWWGEVAPDLPQCWLGQKTAIAFGRVLDETLILSLLRLSSDQAADLNNRAASRLLSDMSDAHGVALDSATYVLRNNLNLLP